MSQNDREKWKNRALNAILAMLASVFVLFGTGWYSAKESVTAHKADIQAIHDDFQRVLDVVCPLNPKARPCQSKADMSTPNPVNSTP